MNQNINRLKQIRLNALAVLLCLISIVAGCSSDANENNNQPNNPPEKPTVLRECEPNAKKCDGEQIKYCRAGKWSASTVCPPQGNKKMVCTTNNDGKADCTEQKQKPPCIAECEGTKIKLCDQNGTLQDAQPCKKQGEVCHQETGQKATCIQAQCTENRCVNGELQPCNNGLWGVVKSCEADQVCSTSTPGPIGCRPRECKDNEAKCSDSDPKTLKSCSYGLFNDVPCQEDETCETIQGTAKCACTNTTTRCDGNKLVTCTNKQWDYENAIDCYSQQGKTCIKEAGTHAACG